MQEAHNAGPGDDPDSTMQSRVSIQVTRPSLPPLAEFMPLLDNWRAAVKAVAGLDTSG